MQLSNRLKEVANFVTKGNRVADIGTDHGYVPIYLIKENIAKSVIAMDVKKGPLERAKAHIAEAGLGDRIQIRFSDGLEALNSNEVDTVVIAGMGGPLMMKILSEGKSVLETVSELILSPQSNVAEFREYLQLNNYLIIKETMIKEDEKYYNIMQVKKGVMNYDRYIYFKYGKRLIEEKHPILQLFIEKEAEKYQKIQMKLKEQLYKITAEDEINIKKNQRLQLENRLREVRQELKWIAEVKETCI